MKITNITTFSTTRNVVQTKEYYLNFQLGSAFFLRNQNDKLGIQLDKDGNFVSLYLNNKKEKAGLIFKAGSEWNVHLSTAIK
jgi:hypothetical protein